MEFTDDDNNKGVSRCALCELVILLDLLSHAHTHSVKANRENSVLVCTRRTPARRRAEEQL